MTLRPAMPAEIARYLRVEPEDVARAIKSDKLPAFRVMKATRFVQRIPLRDFHAWLLARTENPAPHLRDFEGFLADFRAAQPAREEKEAAA